MYIEEMKGEGETQYWVLFEHGFFSKPTAILTEKDMEKIAKKYEKYLEEKGKAQKQ